MSLPLSSPPENLCLLRLSAIGDICHTLPIVRTIQYFWPETKITWVIGKLESTLIGDIPDIEFIIFDKGKGFSAYRQLHQRMKDRHFDVLLHMQMSLRASLASLLIPASIKLGFDKQRANDLQWLFTTHKIPFKQGQHVIDSFFGFIETLGIHQRVLEWNIPLADDIVAEVISRLPEGQYVVISPCSSMSYRDWSVEGYAAVSDYLADHYDLPVILTGGITQIEKDVGEKIMGLCKHKPLNLIGKTNLKQLLVILDRAVFVIAPDSGPAHMATAVNTPVVGLYAATNPDRARPYLSEETEINRYPDAVLEKYAKPVSNIAWGTRIKEPQAMEKITFNDVKDKIDQLLLDVD